MKVSMLRVLFVHTHLARYAILDMENVIQSVFMSVNIVKPRSLGKDCPLNCKYCGKEGHAPVKNAQNYVRFVRRKIVHVIVRNTAKANKNALAKKSVKIVIKSSLCECGQEDSEIEPYVEDKMVQLIL